MREYKKEDKKKKTYIKIEKLKKMERLKAELRAHCYMKSSAKSKDHSLKMQRFRDMHVLLAFPLGSYCMCLYMDVELICVRLKYIMQA